MWKKCWSLIFELNILKFPHLSRRQPGANSCFNIATILAARVDWFSLFLKGILHENWLFLIRYWLNHFQTHQIYIIYKSFPDNFFLAYILISWTYSYLLNLFLSPEPVLVSWTYSCLQNLFLSPGPVIVFWTFSCPLNRFLSHEPIRFSWTYSCRLTPFLSP